MTCDEKTNKDVGPKPTVLNIHNESLCNQNFRTVLWTGEQLQITVMSVPIGGEIGLEFHDDMDQFIKVEQGCANVYMGESKEDLKCIGKVYRNCAIIVPAGTWHNIVNSCSCPLKLYSVYAPPKHPFGTIHKTKLDSDLSE